MGVIIVFMGRVGILGMMVSNIIKYRKKVH